MALKASSSFDNDEDELDDNESKEDEDEMVFLSKKLQRKIWGKKKELKRKENQYLKGKIKIKMSKKDHVITLVL